METASNTDAPLKRSLLFAFALPSLVIGFMHGPEGIIQGVYAKQAGIGLSALAAAVLFTRIFDAVTYPVIGYLSDLTFARTGTRKAWILGGAALSAAGVWFLYRPPQGVTVLYFGLWTGVTYVGWKVSEIPYLAWSYGLSHDYAQRARIQAWRTIATLLGAMLFFVTPYAASALKLTSSPELNFAALGVTAAICAICVPLASLNAVFRVPEGDVVSKPTHQKNTYGVVMAVRAIMRNGPMLRLMASYVPVSVLTGMSAGVLFLFIDVYLGLTKSFALIMLVTYLATVVGTPFWSFLCMRYERHRVMAVAFLLTALAYASMAFVAPGSAAAPAVMALYPIAAFCLLGVVATYSMMADVSDYGRLQTGEDLSGLYASALAFVARSLGSVSAALGIAFIGWFGFEPTSATQTAAGVLGIKLAAVILPASGFAGSALIIWDFPLTRTKLAEIRTALSAPERGAAPGAVHHNTSDERIPDGIDLSGSDF